VGLGIAQSGYRRLNKVWDAETGRVLNVLSNDREEDASPEKSPNGKDAGVTSVAVRPINGLCVAAVF
jgi:hypothetical protein